MFVNEVRIYGSVSVERLESARPPAGPYFAPPLALLRFGFVEVVLGASGADIAVTCTFLSTRVREVDIDRSIFKVSEPGLPVDADLDPDTSPSPRCRLAWRGDEGGGCKWILTNTTLFP